MNREIKFRAWDKPTNTMKEVLILLLHLGRVALREDEERMCYTNAFEVELMQYTGLNDKNNKEIYEGDIVKAEESKIMCEVIYTEGAMFMLRWNDTKWGNNEDHHYGLGAFTLEVIGNIYEDKHLLEG